MNETFNLDETSGIFIYSAGTTGRHVCQKMLGGNFNVKGFIYRNAQNIKIYENLPVYTLSELKNVYKAEDVVIVALNNGLEHETVARTIFLECGINKIIYLHMHVQSNYEQRHKFQRLYKAIYSSNFKVMKDIPIYKLDENFHDIKIIGVFGDQVYFWCPISELYGSGPEGFSKFINSYHDDFYNWLENKDVDISRYLSFIPHKNRTPDEIKNWLNDRAELVRIFEDALKYDINFFTDSPAEAYWNWDKNFWVAWDGGHRTFFLIHHGYDRVPIRVPLKDFEQYIAYKEKLTKEKKNKLKTFNVSAKDTFIIYGAAHRGKDILTRLKNQGFSVECFLDKRADELVEVEGVKVVHPDNYFGDKGNNVVVLAISDPVPVANRLKSLGFKKLIYKVFQVFQYKNLPIELKMMDKAFRQLMDGKMGGVLKIYLNILRIWTYALQIMPLLLKTQTLSSFVYRWI